MLTRRSPKLGVVLASTVVALAGVAGFVVAGPAGATSQGVLRLHERASAERLVGAVTNSRPAQGDQYIFASDLFAPSGAKVGTGAGVCTVVSAAASPQALCQVTRTLAQGQVVTTGVTPFGPQKPSFTTAIVGGTGKYRGTKGVETVADRPNAAQNGSDITLRLNK
jgi:hypothetical protein